MWGSDRGKTELEKSFHLPIDLLDPISRSAGAIVKPDPIYNATASWMPLSPTAQYLTLTRDMIVTVHALLPDVPKDLIAIIAGYYVGRDHDWDAEHFDPNVALSTKVPNSLQFRVEPPPPVDPNAIATANGAVDRTARAGGYRRAWGKFPFGACQNTSFGIRIDKWYVDAEVMIGISRTPGLPTRVPTAAELASGGGSQTGYDAMALYSSGDAARPCVVRFGRPPPAADGSQNVANGERTLRTDVVIGVCVDLQAQTVAFHVCAPTGGLPNGALYALYGPVRDGTIDFRELKVPHALDEYYPYVALKIFNAQLTLLPYWTPPPAPKPAPKPAAATPLPISSRHATPSSTSASASESASALPPLQRMHS